MSYQLSFYKSDVVGGESNPNSVAPGASRITRVPRDNSGGYACVLNVLDGTSLVVTLWYKDTLSALWIPLMVPTTILANDPYFFLVPPDVDLFAQLGTNTGSVTKFGFGFVAPEALNEMQFDANGNLKIAISSTGNSVIYGEYNATPPTLFTGQLAKLQIDSRGNLKIAEQYQAQAFDDALALVFNSERANPSSTGAWSNTNSAGTKVGTAGINLKASAGRLRYIAVMNNAATKYYLMIFNKASAPVNGDAPVARKVIANAADAFAEMDFGPDGLWLATGVSWALSSTPDTLTLAVANDAHYIARWI